MREKKTYIIILSFLLLLFSTVLLNASEIDPLVLNDGITEDSYPLFLNLEYYEDKTLKLSIEDIQTDTIKFKKVESKYPSFGYIESAIWLKFSIENRSEKELLRYLEFEYPLLDLVQLFIPAINGKYKVKQGGDDKPFDDREYKSSYIVFPFKIPAGHHTYFVRVKDNGSLKLYVSLWNAESLNNKNYFHYLINGILYGLLGLMILFSVFIFFLTKELDFLFFVFMLVSFLLSIVQLNGLGFQYIWPDSLWMTDTVVFSFLGITFFGGLFFRSSLKLREFSPIIDRILIAYLILDPVLVFSAYFVTYQIGMIAITISAVIAGLIVIAGSVTCFFKGSRIASFYSIAWIFLVIIVVAVAPTIFGLVETNFFTKWGFHFSIVPFLVIILFGLADNLNVIQKDLRALNVNLENKVEERTQELETERNKLKSRNEIIEKELTLARKIQEELIPKETPVNYISALYEPMEQVGGDFYDFFSFSDSDKIGIFLSDVSGHGVPAAFITSMLKTTILQSGDKKQDPAELLFYMNEVLQNQIAGNFITAFYGIYDPKDRSLLFSNAGHNQPYIIQDKVTQLQGGKNTALAMFPNNMLQKSRKSYENYNETIPSGSKLLLYTDGMTETRPLDSDDFFETSVMFDLFLKFKDLASHDFIESLYKELVVFRQSDSFDDDICLVCVDVG